MATFYRQTAGLFFLSDKLHQAHVIIQTLYIGMGPVLDLILVSDSTSREKRVNFQLCES